MRHLSNGSSRREHARWHNLAAQDLVREHARSIGLAFAVVLEMAGYADDKGYAWPSRERLAATFRLSVRHIQRLITEAVEAGDLVRIRKGNQHRSTVYRIAHVLDLARADGRACTGSVPCSDSGPSKREHGTDVVHAPRAHVPDLSCARPEHGTQNGEHGTSQGAHVPDLSPEQLRTPENTPPLPPRGGGGGDAPLPGPAPGEGGGENAPRGEKSKIAAGRVSRPAVRRAPESGPIGPKRPAASRGAPDPQASGDAGAGLTPLVAALDRAGVRKSREVAEQHAGLEPEIVDVLAEWAADERGGPGLIAHWLLDPGRIEAAREQIAGARAAAEREAAAEQAWAQAVREGAARLAKQFKTAPPGGWRKKRAGQKISTAEMTLMAVLEHHAGTGIKITPALLRSEAVVDREGQTCLSRVWNLDTRLAAKHDAGAYYETFKKEPRR